MPTFTIITVCLNIASTIRRTCESIVNQTFQDFQWIVVDGASTDGTLDILKEYSSRINILISEPDKGIYNAMNKGIKFAIGEYINFMNGGDEFFDNTVLEMIFNKKITSDVVYGDSIYISKTKEELFSTENPITSYGLYYFYRLAHASSFIKTNIQKKYKYNEKMCISADREFFSKLFVLNYSFQKYNIIISKFYTDGISNQNIKLKTHEDIIIKKKYLKKWYIKDNYPYIYRIIEFISNSLQHPRYFAGWFKRLIIKR